jgi:thiosulfate dehydrogenase [quinone] large subunit
MEGRIKTWAAFLRVALGILFLYAGVTKIIDPAWSAAGYLHGAITFHGFYEALTAPGIIGFIDFINKWGLTLLGLSLVLGLGVRISTLGGALLMALYYFPVLKFPYIAPHSFLVDEHVVYFFALLILRDLRAGKIYGLASSCQNWGLCRRYPALHSLLD